MASACHLHIQQQHTQGMVATVLEVHVYVVLTPSFPGGKKCSWKMDIQWMLLFLGKAAFSKQFRCKSVVHHKLNSTQLRGEDRLPARRPQWSRNASQAKNCESNCFGRLQNITRNSSHNLYFHIHMIIYVCNCMYCISILYVLYEIYIIFTTIFL
jgi:hypothetical protein